jgi:hypothetical protein
MGIISWLTSVRDPEEPNWIRRLVMPRPGRDNLRVDARKLAAEADVEDIEREGHEYFPEDAPGHSENDL